MDWDVENAKNINATQKLDGGGTRYRISESSRYSLIGYPGNQIPIEITSLCILRQILCYVSWVEFITLFNISLGSCISKIASPFN